MSLQAWLPLNGDTINVGLNCLEASSIGEIMYASGLFGGRCFNAGAGAVVAPLSSIPEAFTISIWYKGLISSQNATLIAFGNSDDRVELDTNSLAYMWKNNGSGILPNDTKLFDVVFDGNWNHLAIIADGTTVKVYHNGSLTLEAEQANSNNIAFGADANIYVGSKSNGTGKWNGYIQDVKVFDHAASVREIKEIAKGMVLEYTFNHNGFGNENLLIGSQGKLVVTGTGKVNRVENDRMHATLTPGTYVLSATTTGIWTNVNNSDGVVVAANDPTTFPTALEIYTKSGDDVASRTFYDMTGGSAIVTISIGGEYYVGGIVYGDGVTEVSATFDELKLEVGTKATPWIPPKSSAMYIDMEIGTVEQDTSGNNLDGTISDPPPGWSNDSRIFSGSYDFSNSSYIESPAVDVTNLSKFTVMIWAKAPVLTNKILFGFDSGPRFNFSTVNGVFGIYDVENGKQVPFGEGIPVANYISGWHWYVITGNGTVEKLYIDGEYMGDAAGYIRFGLNKFFVNGWDATALNNFNGFMSDLRIYATAFTAEQIRDMFHQKAAVDNTGRIYGSEFISGAESTAVTKNGIVRATSITTFNTPITPESEETDDADKFRISATKLTAVDVFES